MQVTVPYLAVAFAGTMAAFAAMRNVDTWRHRVRPRSWVILFGVGWATVASLLGACQPSFLPGTDNLRTGATSYFDLVFVPVQLAFAWSLGKRGEESILNLICATFAMAAIVTVMEYSDAPSMWSVGQLVGAGVAAQLYFNARLRQLTRLWTVVGVAAVLLSSDDMAWLTGAVQILSLLIVKLSQHSIDNANKDPPTRRRCVALVLDGFVGPDGVMCGITVSVNAWIKEMLADERDLQVLIYSAFDADQIHKFFGSNPRLECYQLKTFRVCYVKQVYYGVMTRKANFMMMYRSLVKHRPETIHTICDGCAIVVTGCVAAFVGCQFPDYSPALIGIMHTDASAVMERNGFPPIMALGLRSLQRFATNYLIRIGTRSVSFKETMKKKYNWKFDFVVRPHVKTEIFNPNPPSCNLSPLKELRAQLTWGHPEALLVVYAGRLDVDKRCNELLEVLAAVDNVYAVFIGDGTMGEKLASMHGASHRIFCEPKYISQEELANYYACADIHVSASQMETLGNTVLESMACGTPVLVCNAQGFRDTVQHNVNGWMWETDNLEDAKQKLRVLRDDRAVLKRLTAGARDSIAALTCSATVDTLLEEYRYSYRHVAGRFWRRLLSFLISCILFPIAIFVDYTALQFFVKLVERLGNEEVERSIKKQ